MLYEIFSRHTSASFGRYEADDPVAAIQALLGDGSPGDSGTTTADFEARPVPEYAAVYDAAADRWEARYAVAQPGYPETGYGPIEEQAVANLLEPMPLYNVVRRDSTQRSPVTDKPTFRAYGSTTADLHRALVEADARNLLLGEAEADRWEVVDEADNPIDPTEIAAAADTMEPGDVADFLVEVFGLSQAEADRLVS